MGELFCESYLYSFARKQARLVALYREDSARPITYKSLRFRGRDGFFVEIVVTMVIYLQRKNSCIVLILNGDYVSKYIILK